MATSKAKAQALIQEKERRRLEAKGLGAAAKIGLLLRRDASNAVKTGKPVVEAISLSLELYRRLLTKAMLAADLTARVRTVINVTKGVKENNPFAFQRRTKAKAQKAPSIYDRAIAIMQARLEFNDEQLTFLEDTYGARASEVVDGIGALTSDEVNQLIAEATELGTPPVKAAQQVRAELARLGLDPGNPYQLETIFRTQTLTAYNAARWQMLQDPDVQEILWGYEYVTAGDERVRDSHVAMDGTRLPKNAQEWSSLWPPNGWNCRCTTVEIIRGDPLARKKPLKDKKIGGKLVEPKPDEGWAFNPGEAFDVPQVNDILKRAVTPSAR